MLTRSSTCETTRSSASGSEHYERTRNPKVRADTPGTRRERRRPRAAPCRHRRAHSRRRAAPLAARQLRASDTLAAAAPSGLERSVFGLAERKSLNHAAKLALCNTGEGCGGTRGAENDPQTALTSQRAAHIRESGPAAARTGAGLRRRQPHTGPFETLGAQAEYHLHRGSPAVIMYVPQ